MDRIAIAYLDNILIYSINKEEHVIYVREVLECLFRAELLLKPEKCEFYKGLVVFLRFQITTSGIQISSEKINLI